MTPTIRINLLPLQEKLAIQKRTNLDKISLIMRYFLLSQALILISIISIYTYYTTQNRVLNNKIQSYKEESSTIDLLNSKITTLNSLLDKSKKSEKENRISPLVKDIQSLFENSNLKPTEITIDIENNIGKIAGISPTRTDLLNFNESLKKLSRIEKANLPLSNLVQSKDFPFTIDLSLKK